MVQALSGARLQQLGMRLRTEPSGVKNKPDRTSAAPAARGNVQHLTRIHRRTSGWTIRTMTLSREGKKLRRGRVRLPITGHKARDHRLLPPFPLPHFFFYFFLSSWTASLPSLLVFVSLWISRVSIVDQFVFQDLAAVTVLLTNHMQNGC